MSKKESKAIATFFGLALGDALGCFTEFISFNPKRNLVKTGWEDIIEFNKDGGSGRMERKTVGIITDDCSMAKCLADSLLANELCNKNTTY